MVQSLIQRIRENKLDALYLFINESLRDRNEFDVFFHNLMAVLPNNWSINRVEIGHEFLSRTVPTTDHQQAGQAQGNNNNENDRDGIPNDEANNNKESKQDQLFRVITSLESLRSLIISDGYIPRKDHGFVDTKALLRSLPRANNLQYLDIQRLKLRISGDGIENSDAELLAESLDSLRDSLEDLRLTAISMHDTRKTIQEVTTTTEEQETPLDHQSQCALEHEQKRYPLDATIRVCGEMANLQLLAISCACDYGCNSDNGEDRQQIDGGDDTVGNWSQSSNNTVPSTSSLDGKSCLISREVLLHLCRSSSTLQELALRSMRIDNDTCETIAKAFDPPANEKNARTYMPLSSSSLSLPCSDSENDNDDDLENDITAMNGNDDHHSPSFWTSLDLRQNPSIGTAGYEAILSSLERNYDLWCSLMVDNDSFQSRFNALIELNQANRGALVRSPSPEKLAVFLDRLKDDPTALWYFLTIHRDSILHPLIRFLKWKNSIHEKYKMKAETERIQKSSRKRSVTETLSLPSCFQPIVLTNSTTSSTNDDRINAKDAKSNQNNQPLNTKRRREFTEEMDLSI